MMPPYQNNMGVPQPGTQPNFTGGMGSQMSNQQPMGAPQQPMGVPQFQQGYNFQQPQYGQPAGGMTQAPGMPQYTGMMGGSPANTSPMAQQMGVVGTQPVFNAPPTYDMGTQPPQAMLGGVGAIPNNIPLPQLTPEQMERFRSFADDFIPQTQGGNQQSVFQLLNSLNTKQGMGGLQQIAQPQPQVGTITGGGNTFPYLMTDMVPKGPGQQPIGTQTGPRPVSPTTATTGVNPNLHGGLNIKDYMAQVRTLRDAMFAAPIGSSAREAARQQLDAINRRWHGNPAPLPSATSPVRNPNPTAPSPLAVKK